MANFISFVICSLVIVIQFPHYSSKNHLRSDISSLTIASTDYGNIVHNKPSSVLDPTSIDDISSLVKNSPPTTTIAARGHGHSVRGQDMALDGVVVNMSSLSLGSNRIVIGNDSSYVDVGAEQLWANVLQSTLKHGQAPLSWVDYLYLTVGGTLSNAGISGQSFLHGPQISNVLELDVVTGKGEFFTCSPRENSELFYAVLGGLGQFGIMTRARIVIGRAPATAKVAKLIYANFSDFTKDQERLISRVGPSYVEGLLIVNTTTLDQWRFAGFSIDNRARAHVTNLLKRLPILYSIELAMYCDHKNAHTIDKDFNTMLKELNFIRGLAFISEVSYSGFLNRIENLYDPHRGSGSELYHPWLNLFIPKSRIRDFNRLILVGMLPRLNWSSSPFIFYPLNKTRWDDKMSAVTPDLTLADSGVFYNLGLLHEAPYDKYQSLDDFNSQLLKVCQEGGIKVKQYLPSYDTDIGWRHHFGSKWNTFQARKRMFDPNYRLSPGQRIFN